MANPKRICSVPNCDKPSRRWGLCSPHSDRQRAHGDPLADVPFKNEAPKFFWDVVVPFKGEQCLPWPFSITRFGYGCLVTDGKREQVHRKALIAVTGAPPDPDMHAAHNCGNRSCCNPTHLRWATAKENASDKAIHGTEIFGARNGSNKLTEQQVRIIRDSRGKVSQIELANQFGVSRGTVGEIQRREIWAWLGD